MEKNCRPSTIGAFLKGVSIVKAELDYNNYLIIYLSNGETYNAGQVPACDDILDYASERPVKNKTLYAAIKSLQAETKGLRENKVDKVDGKGLSTEDFSTQLKDKLEGLENYDDISLQTKIHTIESRVNALIGTSSSTAIDNFNEIVGFLKNIEDSTTLDGIIAGIGQQLADKVDKVEGKGLSTNDFDDNYRAKIDELAENSGMSTPSGDPCHALYVALGATWDGSAWQYNGLAMSDADMASVLVARRVNVSNASASINNATIYAGASLRTNVEATHYQPNNTRYFGDGALLVAESKIEVLVLNSGGSGVCRFTNLRNAFYQATRLRRVVGILDLSQCTDFNFSFQYANNMEEVYIVNTKGLPIRFNSTKIAIPCLTYLVNNSGTGAFTLTVPASVYSAAMADTDFKAALEAHPNITFAQA